MRVDKRFGLVPRIDFVIVVINLVVLNNDFHPIVGVYGVQGIDTEPMNPMRTPSRTIVHLVVRYRQII